MSHANDNDKPETLEDIALMLWDVLDVLDNDGEHEAAQELRDQCEIIVRDAIAAAAE